MRTVPRVVDSHTSKTQSLQIYLVLDFFSHVMEFGTVSPVELSVALQNEKLVELVDLIEFCHFHC